jgi:hypothetical protein
MNARALGDLFESRQSTRTKQPTDGNLKHSGKCHQFKVTHAALRSFDLSDGRPRNRKSKLAQPAL